MKDFIKNRIKKKQKGALLLELLIVISLLAVILSVAANAVFLSIRSNKISGERDVANSLASESLEAVRAVTEEDWQNIYSLTGKGSTHYKTTSSGSGLVKALVVGGGGGGGENYGGGGGAGGYQYDASHAVTSRSYAITVGGGGSGGTTGNGTNGGDSSFDTDITATGGGGGGGRQETGYVPLDGNSGASGGGGSYSKNGGSGSQGYGGGNGNGNGSVTPNYTAGGGGGSAVVGNTATDSTSGAGGAGTLNPITGSGYLAAGGGGGANGNGGLVGSGGSGVGGDGGTVGHATGYAGAINTGSGGGGGYGNVPSNLGGAGGSGIVIISYPTGSITATGGTITTSGSDTIHTFTSNGTFTVTDSLVKWILMTGDEIININNTIYTRYLNVDNVSRDSSTRNIQTSYVSADDDPSTQKVTATVSWLGGSPITISGYFFRWENKICAQSGWTTGGSGNTVKLCSDASYDTKDADVDAIDGTLKVH